MRWSETTRVLPAAAREELEPKNDTLVAIELGKDVVDSEEIEIDELPPREALSVVDRFLGRIRSEGAERLASFDRGSRALEARLRAMGGEAVTGTVSLRHLVDKGREAVELLTSRLGVLHERAKAETLRMVSDPVLGAEALTKPVEIHADALDVGADARRVAEVARADGEALAFERLSELSKLESSVVPGFLKGSAPDVLHKALREGAEHPRFRVEPAFRQYVAYRDHAEHVPLAESVVERYLPTGARDPYRSLVSGFIPDAFRADARRAANQIMNGFYAEASASIATLRDRMRASGGEAEEAAWFLNAVENPLMEAAAIESSRHERLADRARGVYDAILSEAESSNRHDAIRARIERETALREGKVVAMRPLAEKDYEFARVDSSYSPVWAQIEHNGKRYEAVVKFDLSDRYTRSGVTPGTGSLREVVGSLSEVAMGNDAAPAVVARELDGYGRVTVMDFVPAKSCSTARNWYKDKDGGLHPDLPAQAVRDFLVRRSDGAPRNLILAEGRIIPIDYGSDFGSPADRAEADYSSVAHYAVSKLDVPMGPDIVRFLERWKSSPARAAFEAAVALLPESMDGFHEGMDARVEELLASARSTGKFPAYDEQKFRMDFGKKFKESFKTFITAL